MPNLLTQAGGPMRAGGLTRLQELEQKERNRTITPPEQVELNGLRAATPGGAAPGGGGPQMGAAAPPAGLSALGSGAPGSPPMPPSLPGGVPGPPMTGALSQMAPPGGGGPQMGAAASPMGGPSRAPQRRISSQATPPTKPTPAQGGGVTANINPRNLYDEQGKIKWAAILAPLLGTAAGAIAGGKKGAALGMLGGSNVLSAYTEGMERRQGIENKRAEREQTRADKIAEDEARRAERGAERQADADWREEQRKWREGQAAEDKSRYEAEAERRARERKEDIEREERHRKEDIKREGEEPTDETTIAALMDYPPMFISLAADERLRLTPILKNREFDFKEAFEPPDEPMSETAATRHAMAEWEFFHGRPESEESGADALEFIKGRVKELTAPKTEVPPPPGGEEKAEPPPPGGEIDMATVTAAADTLKDVPKEEAKKTIQDTDEDLLPQPEKEKVAEVLGITLDPSGKLRKGLAAAGRVLATPIPQGPTPSQGAQAPTVEGGGITLDPGGKIRGLIKAPMEAVGKVGASITRGQEADKQVIVNELKELGVNILPDKLAQMSVRSLMDVLERERRRRREG